MRQTSIYIMTLTPCIVLLYCSVVLELKRIRFVELLRVFHVYIYFIYIYIYIYIYKEMSICLSVNQAISRHEISKYPGNNY